MAEKKETDFSDFQSPHEASVDRLISAVDRAYHRPFLMMWRSFLQGFMTAIGAALGSLLIFTLLAYIFQAKGGIELLRPTIDKIQQMMLSNIIAPSSSVPSNADLDQLLKQVQAQKP